MNDKYTNDTNKMDELLARAAESVNPNAQFTDELEYSLRQAHGKPSSPGWFRFSRKQTAAALAWAVSLIVFAWFMNWAISAVAPIPTEIPASHETNAPQPTETPDLNNESRGTPAPNAGGLDWRGTKLYLNAPLPDSPSQANIYVLKEQAPVTIEQVRALAQQFGIRGEVYVSQNPVTGGVEYLVTDGKQSLSVTTERFFTYTADMSKAVHFLETHDHPDAEAVISEFLQAHGVNFPHRIAKDDLFGGYAVEPLAPDGFSMRYEFFSSRPMRVLLDENGEVLRIEANLMDYEPAGAQTYDIISAEEALQKFMDDTINAGKIESALSARLEAKQWIREYPENETITIYGYSSSVPALDPALPAFIQIDGFTLTGSTGGMEALERNTFVEATGRFINENGIKKFDVESWRLASQIQDGLVGTLIAENGQIILQTTEGERLIVEPEIPADIPLPFENAFVVGVRTGDVYNWTLIDNRMSAGSGGGGGGGLGFYKLNLSGTPVPFPSAAPTPIAGGGIYIVQEGDTLTSIADAFGVTVEQLMQANGITDSLIFIGQQLIIPSGEQIQNPHIGKRLENQRGIVIVTVVRKLDGTLTNEYTFATSLDGQAHFMRLTGDNLQELAQYHNKPVNLWGVIEQADEFGTMTARVERFEIPFPALQFQILRGTQASVVIEGQPAILFTTSGGARYVQITPSGDVDSSILGNEGDEVLLEALVIPDESFGGYPTLRVFSGALAISPKNGQPIELTITADQVYTLDEPVVSTDAYTPPALTIEKIELMYYVTNPYWQADRLDGSPLYIQPVWRFYGHYENGGVFEAIVQALEEEYLLPELAPYIQGG